MRILLEMTTAGAGVQTAARLVLYGHDLTLTGGGAELAGQLHQAVARAELPLARLRDLPLPEPGRIAFVREGALSASGTALPELRLRFSAPDRMSAALPGQATEAELRLSRGAQLLPFVCTEAALPADLTAALGAAGFLQVTAADLALADQIARAAEALDPADQDRALGALLRALRDQGLGPGALLLAQEQALREAPSVPVPLPGGAFAPVRLRVLPSWIDYNGHMTEARYLAACSEVTDVLLMREGFGPDYVATGYSWYTAETHLRHLRECRCGQILTGEIRVLGLDPKRLHLLVTLSEGGTPVATLEQMLLHVDMAAARASALPEERLEGLRRLAKYTAEEPRPAWLGRGLRQIAAITS